MNISSKSNEHRVPIHAKRMRVEIERENDGRWIAEVPDLPGVMSYGRTRREAITKAEALALRVLAGRLEHGEPISSIDWPNERIDNLWRKEVEGRIKAYQSEKIKSVTFKEVLSKYRK